MASMDDPLKPALGSRQSETPATLVTWRLAKRAFWSLSWRLYLGQLAIAAVVAVLSRILGELDIQLRPPQQWKDLASSLPPILVTIVFWTEIALTLHVFRVTVGKHLPGQSGRPSWSVAAFCLWGFVWRFFPGVFGAFVLLAAAFKVMEPAVRALFRDFWVAAVIGIVCVLWPFYAGQVWAMRGALRAVLKRTN